jgi:hypothetical protein
LTVRERQRVQTCAALAVVGLLAWREATPIVRRHDVPDARIAELAARFPAAVNVRPTDASLGFGGEGTLIASRWVLTAAHVAATVNVGDLVVAGGRSYPIDRVVVHPEWRQIADLKRDLALVRVRFDVGGIEPVRLFEGEEAVGTVVTFVGRGGFGTGVAGVRGEDRHLRAATNRLDGVDEAFLKFRFDAPGDPHVTALEGISGPGDSGGGALIEQGGKVYVLGISSWQDTRPTKRVQGVYGVIENYVRVSIHRDWILRTMNARD